MDFLGGRVMRGIWCGLIGIGATIIVHEMTNDPKVKRGTMLGHGSLYTLVGLVVVAIVVAVGYVLIFQKVKFETRLIWLVLPALALLFVGRFTLHSIGGVSHVFDWWSATGFFACLVIIVALTLCAVLGYTMPDRSSK